jgi:predicted glycoside hydrolase/deacetylase ChbG (UPF0249 family)
VTELACHPGLDLDDFDSPYRTERVVEVQTLCDQRVAATIQRLGIRLLSFRELGPLKLSA